MAIAQRAGFSKLLDRMEKGDVLIVTKLDRLGRDAIDVSTTVTKLEDIGIRVHCLALGGVDLTSSTGKMTMNVINAVAQFERDLLIERTQSGLARAKAENKSLGQPSVLSTDQQVEVKEKIKIKRQSHPSHDSSRPAGRQSCASEIKHNPVGLRVPLLG